MKEMRLGKHSPKAQSDFQSNFTSFILQLQSALFKRIKVGKKWSKSEYYETYQIWYLMTIGNFFIVYMMKSVKRLSKDSRRSTGSPSRSAWRVL